MPEWAEEMVLLGLRLGGHPGPRNSSLTKQGLIDTVCGSLSPAQKNSMLNYIETLVKYHSLHKRGHEAETATQKKYIEVSVRLVALGNELDNSKRFPRHFDQQLDVARSATAVSCAHCNHLSTDNNGRKICDVRKHFKSFHQVQLGE